MLKSDYMDTFFAHIIERLADPRGVVEFEQEETENPNERRYSLTVNEAGTWRYWISLTIDGDYPTARLHHDRNKRPEKPDVGAEVKMHTGRSPTEHHARDLADMIICSLGNLRRELVPHRYTERQLENVEVQGDNE